MPLRISTQMPTIRITPLNPGISHNLSKPFYPIVPQSMVSHGARCRSTKDFGAGDIYLHCHGYETIPFRPGCKHESSLT